MNSKFQVALNWLADSPVASWLRVFVSIVLGDMVAEWAKLGSFDFKNWQVWLLAGVVAVVPMIIRWLNPLDTAFGRGSAKYIATNK